MILLRQLIINDLAIIDQLNLDFDKGLTVLTGETGAGKSILLDALGLVLGDRADSGMIRAGRDKTEVTAIFAIKHNSSINALLESLDIETDDELFIRRTIARDGRSRAYLNNTPIPIQSLRDAGEYLVDIHGQHAHQSLSRPKVQRQLLDQSGSYKALLDEIIKTFNKWKAIRQQLDATGNAGDDYKAKLELLRYQIDELEELNTAPSDYIALCEEHKRLSHSQRILDTCQKALAELSDSDAAIRNRIQSYQREFVDLTAIDQQVKNIANLFDNASIQLEEANSELRRYIGNFDADTDRLLEIEDRLDRLHTLSRKYKVKPEQLPEHRDRLISQLKKLSDGQKNQEQLQGEKAELTEYYFKLADELHQARCKASDSLSRKITEKMYELGMGGKFHIDVETIREPIPQQYGMDKISFMVSSNPGQPLRAITKVASGGELSRLSLAIQILASRDTGVPTMVFDEVDAGISGGIAEIVGKLLHKLAEHRQLFCVTHLAQVAACGNQHFRVSKINNNNETFTQIEALEESTRIDEIARLLAGMKITDESRANAAQMLKP